MTDRRADPARRAIILPGARYTHERPLLHFTAAVLEAAGWSVEAATWPAGEHEGDPAELVMRITDSLIGSAENAALLLIGKSLGSLATPLAAERAIPGIWLTPLLRQQSIAAALDALPPATLLIGSPEDETWDGEAARRSGHEVLELPGANHSLECPGDAVGSVDHLRTIVVTVSRFVSTLDGRR